MAESKRAGGIYYLPDTKDADGKTIHGKAVDANGEEIKDAPKRPANTSPEEMARVAQSSDPVQRLADTLTTALGAVAKAPAPAPAPKRSEG